MAFAPVTWRVRSTTLTTADHTLIVGVLNVTSDSFSDGGRFSDAEGAVAAGRALWAAGADLVDVGGESTRPGSTGVAVGEELDRVVPVVAGLVSAGVAVSVDTSKPAVAAAALDVGAEVVNDVTALAHPEMVAVCAQWGAGVVLMHMQGTPATMQLNPRYDDVVAEVERFLLGRAEVVAAAGIAPDRICLDPGIGFGKRVGHSLELLAGLGALVATGYPVLVGTSRKGFLGEILSAAGHPAPAAQRDQATHATTALAVAAGAAAVRVHDVAGALQAARTADAIVRRRHRVEDVSWQG
ncbi:MAG: dihydropteroate synthase [Acidimicrobiia bacterium]|nr:dihydropteroate synthase [Acidimicrobiia bacterium]